jgi:hypothetical protein
MANAWLELFNRMADGHPRFPEYAGLTLPEALTRATAERGPLDGKLRIWDPDAAPDGRLHVTADLQPTRLNLLVRGGEVLAAALF